MFGRNEVLRMNILIAGGTGYIGSHICVESVSYTHLTLPTNSRV